MATETVVKRPTYDIFRPDRPGWIPEWVGDDWNPHPYAYQTREELMPAGNIQSLYIQLLAEMLTTVLERRGLRRFIDVFIFYRDWEQRKQRIAPDMLIAPPREADPAKHLHAYDLDIEPLPLCAFEVISPGSRESDTQKKRLFYAILGIDEYLLLDVEDEEERALDQVILTLWRREGDRPTPVAPDAEGYLALETLGVRLRADGQRLIAQDLETGEFLRTTSELAIELAEVEQARVAAEQARVAAEQARVAAEQARVAAEQRVQAETAARQEAEDELVRLREELARLRGSQ
jgi:Uma2 family endonuclease